jgi:CheY-like chemotaxis protein
MSDDAKRPLGKILLQKKLVSQQDLDAALRAQKRSTSATPQPLASQLAESGALNELEALRALSEQHGVPGIDLGQIAILLEHLNLVPREVSESRLILCVLARGERLFLAMANPMDRRVIDEVEFVTGRKVYPYVALTGALNRTISKAYDALARGDAYFLGPRVPPETLKQLGLSAPPPERDAGEQKTNPEHVDDDAPAPPSAAVQAGAPGVVVDDTMRDVGARAEMATGDFGNLTADISSVMQLPDELRVAPGMSASGAGVAGQGKLILVVDDEEEIRKLLQKLLTGKGFRVVEADRGQLALRMVKEHVPDAILLDAMLPEIHGFDIARRIKGSERYGNIPIIMISAVYKGWRIAEDL